MLFRLSLVVFFFATASAIGQTYVDLSLDKPYEYEGFEYAVELRNENTKMVKKDEFSKFELRAYVRNVSNYTRLFIPSNSILDGEPDNLIAKIEVLNATGKRLSAKDSKLYARSYTVPYDIKSKNAEGKEVKQTVQVPAGFILRAGDMVNDNFTVFLPLGEQPKLRLRLYNLKR
jgi:hypothetical protein